MSCKSILYILDGNLTSNPVKTSIFKTKQKLKKNRSFEENHYKSMILDSFYVKSNEFKFGYEIFIVYIKTFFNLRKI